MKRTIKGLFLLITIDGAVNFVVINTLMGVLFAQKIFDHRVIIILAANFLVVSFYVILNHIKRAPDDVLHKHTTNHNPIAAGFVTPHTAKLVLWMTGLISIVMFAFLGTLPLVIGVISMASAWMTTIYENPPEPSNHPDHILHRIILTGAEFLAGYFAIEARFSKNWYWGLIFVIALNLVSELIKKYRSSGVHRQAKTQNLENISIGRGTHILMFTSIIAAVFSGVMIFISIELFPLWMIILFAALGIIFIFLRLLKMKQQKIGVGNHSIFQNSTEKAAALSLIFYFLTLWVDSLIKF